MALGHNQLIPLIYQATQPLVKKLIHTNNKEISKVRIIALLSIGDRSIPQYRRVYMYGIMERLWLASILQKDDMIKI